MAKEEDKEKKTEAKVIEVTATTAPAFQLEDGRIVEHNEMFVLIYNKLNKIEKAVA